MGLGSRARRALVPLYQESARRAHELRYLFVELTLDCNLRCLHCGSDCTRDPDGPRLEPEVLLRVLRELREHYDPHHLCLALTGGEPLCYPELFELGREIHRLEFPWGMVTNGQAWTPRTVELAKGAAMGSVTVSVDGFAAAHDWLRGRPGAFERATRAVRLLLADRFWQAMDVVTCVHPRNLGELDELHDFLLDLGLGDWRLFVISPIGRAADLAELHLDRGQYRQLLDTVSRLRRRGAMRVSLSESGYQGSTYELAVRDQYFFCRAGINVAGIMANGDILACPNIDRRFRQGNIHTDSFVDVWENRYQQFRDRRWMKTGECTDCAEWRMCQGGSFHLWDPVAGQTRLCHCKRFGL
ncbi:MAG: radical SAM protein [Deltaproteobacteria bacterium]|nr:radical SAM protein [Deltaproteobacteria bacterium]MBW2532537.1 radical SAM protein [Deltaproteobacteria bacterium]